MLKGSCNCKAITFTVTGPCDSVAACHCGQCRKQSGHYWAAAYAPVDQITIQGQPRWYEASATAKRGFCGTCGAFLFWKAHDEDGMSFALGALDGETGLMMEKHIFVADKGDYYQIADGLAQHDQ